MTGQAITHRYALQDDIEGILPLVSELNAFHGDEGHPDAQNYIRNWDRFEVFVSCTRKNQIIAFAAGFSTFHFDHAGIGFEIQNLHVSKNHRRQGIATALLTFIIQEKFNQRAARISIGFQNWNKGAGNLYKSLGFEESKGPPSTRLYLYAPRAIV